MVILAGLLAGPSAAQAETRTLKLYFIHTKEKAEITFKRNGRYDQAGLAKLNRFLRDWRRNEPTKMDPRLFDLVWEVYRAVGARDYINVVSAYRSPATNSMLRSRSKGVAKKSQHMLGKAMDFFIPGISLAKLRATGMKMQVGGVGYYPTSGSPFVHMDVGNVRHWPKMSRRELVALFPNGKTLHIPSDGKPLPGFDEAMASYQARKRDGTSALALASSPKPSKGLLAALFGGGGADEEEESGGAVADEGGADEAPAPKAVAEPKAIAKPAPAAKPEPLPGIRVIPPEDANRVEVAAIPPAPEPEPVAPQAQTPEQILAALPRNAVPVPTFAARAAPAAPVAAEPELATASVEPAQPANIPFAMASNEPPPAATVAGDAAASEAVKPAEPVKPAETVAIGIPLPTPRPELVADPVQTGVALALAPSDPDLESAFPVPALRSDAADPIAQLAALPMEAPQPQQLDVGAAAGKSAELAAAVRESEARVAALSSSQPDAAEATVVPVPAPRSTTKASRATRHDAKPLPKPVVRAVEPKAALWVLNKDYVSRASQNTKAPSFAYNAVVTAPREVYTTGFQKGEQANANRFTGKAVTFISVARFE